MKGFTEYFKQATTGSVYPFYLWEPSMETPRYFRRCCGGRRFEGSVSSVVLLEYICRFDPVGRYGDGFSARTQF
jgi:hypothetical protein